jgi:hypothetical protein
MSNSRRAPHLAVAFAAVSLGACNKAPAPPPASHAMPPLEEAAAAVVPNARGEHAADNGLPAGHPMVGASTAPAMPLGHGQMGMPGTANPHGDPQQAMEAATPGEIPFDAKTIIAGVLKLDAKVKDKVKDGDTIFLVARRADPSGAPGQIMAVKKMVAGTFPMKFQLDSRDAMMAGTKMEGPLVVSARVDKDGDAMTKNPGDVTGSLRVKSLPISTAALMLDTLMQ